MFNLFIDSSYRFVFFFLIAGDPPPTLTWWLGSSLLDSSFKETSPGVYKNKLLLQSLKRQDLLSVVTCQATNNNISLPQSEMITLDMNCKYHFPILDINWRLIFFHHMFRVSRVFIFILLGAFSSKSLGADLSKRPRTPLGAHQWRFWSNKG